MEYKSKEVKAGFFIVLGIITLGGFIFMLGDVKHLLDERKNLTIIFDYTSGLQVGATVRYAGLDVGRVQSIGLSKLSADEGKDNIAVVTEIDPKIRIKKDSRASIKTEGLMGAFYVDIRPGTRSGKPLGPQEPLVGLASFEFDEVGDMVTEVVAQVVRFTDLTEGLIDDSRQTLEELRNTIRHADMVIMDNRISTKKAFKNVERITGELAETLEQTGGDFRETLKNTKEITAKTNRILDKKQTNVESIIDQTDNLTRDLELFMADSRPALTNLIKTLESDSPELSSNIRSAAVNFDQTMQQSNAILVENRRNLLLMLKNLKTTTENLKGFTEDLKRNPWKLVRKSDELPPIAPEKAKADRKDHLRMKRLDKVED
ncbi:MAG: MCE family protein [Candidatus Nitronauta litoralis]|uniref:MCE family protein n=1 Tax=Candidatus Nitronauta litoralis TaxID=2705533 RepID=A0A7T0FZT7_9BACT|nr:MAG: MCE family protein [Candidatus Nitronauta litoralis]